MKELFRRLRTHSRLATELGVASLVINILGLTSSIYSIVVLRRYLAVGLDSTLVTLTVGALLAVVFEFALRHIRVAIARHMSQISDRELSEATFTALAQSQYGPMSRVGIEQSREALIGLSTIQQAYSPFNVLALYDAPFATVYLFALFLISPLLAAIAGSIVVFSLVFGWFEQKKMQGPAQELTKESAQQGIYNTTLISASDSVRMFNWLPILRTKWARQQTLVEGLRSSMQHHQNLAQQLGISSAMLMSILMMGFGCREVLAGSMSVATLIGGNILAGRALSNVNRCSQTLELFAKAGQHLKTLRALATLPLEKDQGTILPVLKGRLEIQDLGFMYSGTSSPLFESLTLKVEPGEVLVVTGANGVGKTTLSKILVGLLEPQRGDIRLDGINLLQFSPWWLRQQLVYLPQEPSFFDGTLRENLSCLKPEIEDSEVYKAAEKTGLNSLLESSSDGLSLPLTGGGRHLSLGIRRRMALCRALIGGGHIFVLDEPTEGLDSGGCQAVAAILNEMIGKKATIIIMSNDPFLVQAANYVLDLNQKPIPLLKQQVLPQQETISSGQGVKHV